VIAEGITITNVSITNAAPTGRILDHSNTVAAPLAGGLTYTIAGGSLANTGTSFYLYPTTLGAGSTGTVITVTAESKTYLIPLAASQPIDANKLYRIMVTQSATSSDLSFKLVVADWTDADNLPTFEDGSVEAGFNPVVSSSQGVSISGDNNVDYSDATGAASVQLFYVSAAATKPTLASITALHGTHAEAINVGISNPVQVTYAGTAGYMSTVTISLPVTKVPVDLEVNLTGTTGDNKTVSVISVPPYYDSRYLTSEPYKPVLRGGKYWSPVNVGATKIEVVTLAQPTVAQMGLYFQWGRNTGFHKDTYTATDAIAGPLAADDPSKKVITTSTGDWLSSRNDLLWSGANEQGPCPDGWRVPTKADFNSIIADYGTKTLPLVSDRRWKSTGSNGNGEILYSVAGGYFPIAANSTLPTNGRTDANMNAAVWSSDVNAAKAHFWYLANDGNKIDTESVNRAWALPVRCVQQ
ncbi:MAG: hypothetical protein LBK65_04370, partial [Tannerellaceae bacterium]|nr:hypothetical protein [Tannerellaceae bacterium]